MNEEKNESANSLPDDVSELKSQVARAGAGPDTTGHLVYLAILVILFSVISGYAQAAATVLASLTGGDVPARAVNYPQFLLDIAEVYNSYPNFTSGIGIFGGIALLILSLYSLFRRYKSKWIAYLLTIAFIGFYVNVLAWINDAPAEVLVEDLTALTPGAYHVILGGILFMLFGMWIGEKFDFLKALLLLILGTFVIFEVQFSMRAMQVVGNSVEESWTTLPELSFLYTALGGIVMSLLILGGALLLIEALAFYDSRVNVKGLVFMFIVVAIPAAFLMWESASFTGSDSFLASEPKVRGGVARHFKLQAEAESGEYDRAAYILQNGVVRDFKITIDTSVRNGLRELADDSLAGSHLTKSFNGGLLSPEILQLAFQNFDLPIWRAQLASLDAARGADFTAATKLILPYFEYGLWDEESVEAIGEFIESASAAPTALRIAYARQLMHRGELVRAGEILEALRSNLDMLDKYKFIQVADQRLALAKTEAELADAQKLGGGGFTLRVKLDNGGKPVFGGLVGLQVLSHKSPVEVNYGEDIAGGDVSPSEPEQRQTADVKSAANLLTQYKAVDENGEAEFRGFMGGEYRLVFFAEALDKPEPDYLGYPYATEFGGYFESGNEYYTVIHFN